MNIEELRKQEARLERARLVHHGRMDLALRGTEAITNTALPARDGAAKWRRQAAKLAKAADTPEEVQPGLAAAIEIADTVIGWSETMDRRVPEVQAQVAESAARVTEAREVYAAARLEIEQGTLDPDESRRRRAARDVAEDALVHLERAHAALLAEGARALDGTHAVHVLQSGIAGAREWVEGIVSNYRLGFTNDGDMSRAGRGIESLAALGFAAVAESEALEAFNDERFDHGGTPLQSPHTKAELAELFATRRHSALEALAEKRSPKRS